MATKIILKKSSVTGQAPISTDLDVGELAVNLADKLLYSKDGTGAIIQLGGSGTGGATTLDGLTDVVITTPTTNEVLKYNGTNWINTVDATGSGSELQQLTVYNGTGSTIVKGSVVYINGAQGQKPSIALASNASEATSSKTFGFVSADIANGADGVVITSGIVPNLNTSGLTEGGPIYLSSTAGQYTQTKPSAPNHLVSLGWIMKAGSGSSGRLLAHIQNGFELQELHNVSIPSPTDGQVLTFNSTTNLWEAETPVLIDTFLELTDTPDTYVGAANQLVGVSAGATGLGFTNEIQISEFVLSAMSAPTTPSSDSMSIYVTASGTTPNREVAYKIKNELGQEIILSSVLV
jgi:hypothetical protein